MNSPLEIEFVISEKCNLACKYCYMNNKNVGFDFPTLLHFHKSLDKVLKLYKRDKYKFVFFGGEPLLQWDLVKQISSFLKQDHRCDSIIIITNTTLLDDEKLDYLKENDIGVSASYDGTCHSANRPLIDGSCSDKFFSKDKLLKVAEVTGGFKTMIAPDNCDQLVENYLYLADELGVVPDLTLVRDDIWDKNR